jgi:hypothetical protein
MPRGIAKMPLMTNSWTALPEPDVQQRSQFSRAVHQIGHTPAASFLFWPAQATP